MGDDYNDVEKKDMNWWMCNHHKNAKKMVYYYEMVFPNKSGFHPHYQVSSILFVTQYMAIKFICKNHRFYLLKK
jgi:hypothetical protein